MGLYVWIALGGAVGIVSRVLAFRFIASDWLESILMGVAGAVVGGWIGARVRGVAGIDDLSWLAMLLAVIGAAILDAIYLFTRRRQSVARRSRLDTVDEPGRKAA